MKVPVTFAEAALGTTVAVPTLNGKPVNVKVPPGTRSGKVFRVAGQGVPVAGQAGRPSGHFRGGRPGEALAPTKSEPSRPWPCIGGLRHKLREKLEATNDFEGPILGPAASGRTKRAGRGVPEDGTRPWPSM